MKTFLPRPEDRVQRWVVVDAEGKVLGRLAARVAALLRGKTRPTFTPHVDTGDFVVVVNAAKVRLTGKKLQQKMLRRVTGRPGGMKETPVGRVLRTHPERVIEHAVYGMLPHNRYGRALRGKLKVYAGPSHPHAAQRPAAMSIEKGR